MGDTRRSILGPFSKRWMVTHGGACAAPSDTPHDGTEPNVLLRLPALRRRVARRFLDADGGFSQVFQESIAAERVIQLGVDVHGRLAAPTEVDPGTLEGEIS